MELFTIDDLTSDYFQNIKLSDMFPENINYLKSYKIDKETEQKLAEEKLPESKTSFKFTQNQKNNYLKINDDKIEITCIKILHNIIAISAGNILKIYDNKLIIQNKNKDLSKITEESIYKVKNDDKIKTLALNIFELENSQNEDTIICALSGTFREIFIIDILNLNTINILYGHRNDVFDLKFNPTNSNILLSSSQDCSCRLWNIKNGNQIVLFGGPNSFHSSVYTIDFHNEGKMFVSGGVDNYIRIYVLNEKISKKIEESENFKKENNNFKTLLKNLPDFECNEIHRNYVDCVKFNGNFILSKSVDGVIKEWLPTLNKEGNYFFLINTYIFHTNQLIVNIDFCFEEKNNLIFVGNELGNGFLFKLCEEEKSNTNDYYFYKNNPVDVCEINNSLIRTCEFEPESNTILFGSVEGKVYFYKIEEYLQN